MAWRISASLGSGFWESRSTAVMIKPGVQKPHCSPCLSQNACCSGCRSPSWLNPSIVLIALPSACTARTVQLLIAWPSISTVHAPHWLVSQPMCVPVRSSSSRSTYASNALGSTSAVRAAPFTFSVMERFMRPDSLSSYRAISGRGWVICRGGGPAQPTEAGLVLRESHGSESEVHRLPVGRDPDVPPVVLPDRLGEPPCALR